jgi:putative membrane protein
MVTLTDDDRRAIAGAVTKAEATTSGEICCVLTEEASHYREVPIAWAAFAALALPAIALGFDLRPERLAQLVPEWTAVEMPALHRHVVVALMCYAFVQVLVFAAVALAVSVAGVRRVLTPSFVKRHRVRRSARHHFAALTARMGDGATVMIYATRFDRMVEVVVSEAAHKACDPAAWQQAADAIGEGVKRERAGEGFVTAVAICGAELAKHFPPSANDAHRSPDTIIEE